MREEHMITRQGRQYVLFAGEYAEPPYGYCRCGCGDSTPTAVRNEYRRGHVKGQPIPYVHGHNRRVQGPHFRIEDTGFETPCWIWLHGKTDCGYAQMSIRGQTFLVHRLTYKAIIGEIPQGHELHHRCEQRDCIRPQHTTPLYHAEHARASSYTKLDLAAVRNIRTSGERNGELARKHGVSPTTICDIQKERRWIGVA